MVYGAVAVLSVLLLIGYLLLEKRKERNFQLLIGCVAVANCGYFLQSAADSLSAAMVANGISYLGSAYSVLAMLLIIYDVCQMKKRSCSKEFCLASALRHFYWQPAAIGWGCITAVWNL